MSKIIERKQVRITNAARVSCERHSIDTEKVSLKQSVDTIDNALEVSATREVKRLTASCINATAEAGFERIDIRVDDNLIRVIGDNSIGEVFITEIRTGNDQVEIKTDSLNVEGCHEANKRFDQALRSQGIEFEMVDTEFGGKACKPPIPVSRKWSKAKKHISQDKNKLSF